MTQDAQGNVTNLAVKWMVLNKSRSLNSNGEPCLSTEWVSPLAELGCEPGKLPGPSESKPIYCEWMQEVEGVEKVKDMVELIYKPSL